MTRIVVATIGTLVAFGGGTAWGQPAWHQFRGPAAGVVPDNPNLPEVWSETDNVAWGVDIPGLAWSSPVVTGDHVFLTSAISAGDEPEPIKGLYDPGMENGSEGSENEHRWMLYDIDIHTGRIRWERELHSAPPPMKRHLKNSFASETPVTDGRRVYVYFGSIGLVGAFNLSGETIWTQEIDVYNTLIEMGTAASPILHDDRLYIVNDNTTRSFAAAFDKDTGEELWRVDRDERGQNWATPFVWENRAPHRARHRGDPGGALLRPRRRPSLGAPRNVRVDHSDPVRQSRPRLHQLGVSGRRDPSGLRGASRRVG